MLVAPNELREKDAEISYTSTGGKCGRGQKQV